MTCTHFVVHYMSLWDRAVNITTQLTLEECRRTISPEYNPDVEWRITLSSELTRQWSNGQNVLNKCRSYSLSELQFWIWRKLKQCIYFLFYLFFTGEICLETLPAFSFVFVAFFLMYSTVSSKISAFSSLGFCSLWKKKEKKKGGGHKRWWRKTSV